MLDLLISNGRIVTDTEVLPLGIDIGVKDGKIVCTGQNLAEFYQSAEIIDAQGAYVTPGGVDSHVHIEQENAPTGDTWTSATRSAIAGGNTTVIAFASQKRSEESLHPTITRYHQLATGNAHCDYGFHVIISNPTESVLNSELQDLVDQGITSVKLYMTYQPLKLGDGELFNVMMKARSLGITTMVHAENNDMVEEITKRLAAHGNTSTFFHSIARPQIAESEATYRAIALAEVTDAPILIVHMSAPAAIKHVSDAQLRSLPIHAETCPQYLFLRSEHLRSGMDDFEGAKYICAPPLRHASTDLDSLWESVSNGTITVLSSDHAPSTYDHANGKKRGLNGQAAGSQPSKAMSDGHACCHGTGDFRNVPNGLPGIETRLPLLFDRTFDPSKTEDIPQLAADRETDGHLKIPLPLFVTLTSTNPAKLYGLADRKGSIQVGYDADIVIWHPESPSTTFTITNDKLHHRIDYTPFEGMVVRNWPRHVILRGKVAWSMDSGFPEDPVTGQFLKRNKGRVLRGAIGRRKATGMCDGGDWKYWG